MAKNVDGAKGCSGSVIAPLNIFVSKYEAIKRERSESANKRKEQGKIDGQKAASPAGSTGSINNADSLITSNGSTTETNAVVAIESNSEGAAISHDDAIEMCTVIYISGDHEYARQEVEKGKSVKFSIGKLPDIPEDSRAEFQGWFTRKMGEDNRKEFSESAPIKENITVYAKWIRTINYYNDDQLIGGREFEIEAPDKKISVAFNLKSKINNGDINDWRIDRGTE